MSSEKLDAVISNLLQNDNFRKGVQEALALSNNGSGQQLPTTSTRSEQQLPTTSTRSEQQVPTTSTRTSFQQQDRQCQQQLRSNTLQTVNPTTSNRIQQELCRLFRPTQVCTKANSKKKFRSTVTEFHKDIILLKGPNTKKVLSGSEKAIAYKEQLVISTKLDKVWSSFDIKNHMRKLFPNFLLSYIDFDFFLPVARELVKPALSPGEDFNGMNVNKIFRQKPLYLIPNQNLPNIIHSDNLLEDTEIVNEIRHDINSEAVIFENAASTSDVVDVVADEIFDKFENKPDSCNLDDFDYEYNLAVANSLKEIEEMTTIECVLKKLQQQVEEGITIFNVNREDVFKCAIRAMRRPSFCPTRTPSVMFTDVDGTTEGAIDSGGPRREFFRLVLQEIKQSKLFEGPDMSKSITLRNEALAENEYFETGRVIAMSLVYGGPGPGFFSTHLYSLLIGEDSEAHIDNVYDYEIKEELQNLDKAGTISELNEILTNSSYLSVAGCPVNTDNFSKKITILKEAVNFFTKHRVRPAIDQLVNGMKILNVYDTIMKHPSLFKDLFCFKEGLVSASTINKLFEINFSEVGSNKRCKENRTVGFFRDFLIDCEERIVDVKLEDILCFVTGADRIPPLGFSCQPTIQFFHEAEIFAKANTCSLELHLPTCHLTYEEFTNRFSYGIKEGMVFGFE